MSSRQTRPRLEPLDARIVPATLWVDDDRGQRPNAPYTSIQAAVDAASAGDTVLVYPGSYAEQLRIGTDANGWPVSLSGRSLNNLTLRSQTPLAATITLPTTAPQVSAIVTVAYSTGVALNGFTIAGPGTTAGQLYDGLEVNQKASVTVRNSLFRDIGDPAGAGEPAPQTGVAVYVGADGGGSATLRDNTFVRYQTAGVVVDGPFSSATVVGNTFAGAGPVGRFQFGVQISQNGSGLVQNNLITGHVYDGSPVFDFDPSNPYTSAGVVIYQAGAVTVSKNDLLANQTGVYVQDQAGTVVVRQNTIAGSTLDGVTLDLARGSATVTGNTVSGSGRDGIHLQSASHNNTVSRNTVTGSGRYGIASVPTQYGPGAGDVVAPSRNVVAGNAVSGSVAFDLFAQSAGGGDSIHDLWARNTYGTKNRPGLR